MMSQLLIFLNQHKDILTLVFSAIAAVAAVVAAVVPIIQARRQARRAELLVSIRQAMTSLGMLDLVVENIGEIPLHNIRIQIQPEDLAVIMRDARLLQNEIPVLQRQEVVRNAIVRNDISTGQSIRDLNNSLVVIKASYKTNPKKKNLQVQAYTYDLKLLMSSMVQGQNPTSGYSGAEVSTLRGEVKALRAERERDVNEAKSVLRRLGL